MLTIENTYNTAVIYADAIDSGAEGLLCALCGSPISEGSVIRVMSRADARQSFTLSQFKKEMAGVYSTSIGRDTLVESPMAYKPMDRILAQLAPTAEVTEIVKPVYSFKAGEK